MMVIEISKKVKKDWQTTITKGKTARTNLELSPQRRPLGKTQTMFLKTFNEAEGEWHLAVGTSFLLC